MNLLDAVILAPILYFCFRGFSEGFIKEFLSIAGIVLAVVLTFRFMDPLSTALQPFFDSRSGYIPFVSGTILFIGTLACANFTAYTLKKLLEVIRLNFINRLAGLAFGFLKGGILVSAALLILAGFNLPSQQSRNASLSYPYVINVAPRTYNAVMTIFPGAKGFSDTIEETLNKYHPVQNFPILDS